MSSLACRTWACIVAIASFSSCGGSTREDAGSGGTPGGGGSSVTGGAPGTGGSSVGGTSATGGTSGGAYAECKSDSECVKFADCCSCTAYPHDQPPPPPCLAVCETDACSAIGLPADQMPVCKVGQCIIGFDCDKSHAACESLPPTCAPGMTVSIVNGCWGGCVPATECATVTDCASCTGSGTLCVNHNQTANEFHCVPHPDQCAGDPSSACLCPLVCPKWNFCHKTSTHVQCDYI